MPTLLEKADFVAELAKRGKAAAADEQILDARKQALEQLVGHGLSASDRAALGQAMRFTVQRNDGKGVVHSMDERGQRKSIETEDTAKYQSLDADVARKAQEALEKITGIKDKLLAQKITIMVQDESGQDVQKEVPLFKLSDLADELYTPFVREGLMPEGLVIDDHSETAKLLKNTYKSYKKMLADGKKQQELDDAEMESNLANAGTKTERLSALGAKVTGTIEARVNRVGAIVGFTPEEMGRAANLIMTGGKLVEKGVALGLDADKLAQTVQNPTKGSKAPDAKKLTEDSTELVAESGLAGKGVYKSDGAYSKADDNIGKTVKTANRNAALKSAAEDAVQKIDEALCGLLGPPQGAAVVVEALSGRFFAAVDIDAMAEASAGTKKGQTMQIADPVAKALAGALAGASPRSETKAAFADAAKELAGLFKGAALKPDTEPPTRVYLPLVEAAAKFQFSPQFYTAIQQCKDSFAEQAKAANEYLVDELAASDEETEEFERQLVLVDDAGEDMARERSLAKMTEQLKKDAARLDLVNKCGSLLTSFGTSAVTLGVDSSNMASGLSDVAGTVASQVGQELVPALKVAQLIIQMSVSVIKIAQRAELLAKFQDAVGKAKKAGSALRSAVENFRNNKDVQQTFAKIELALQAVQLAGAICETVPEPITMATGKLVNGIGKLGVAANTMAQSIYDEKTLRKGWKRTLEALNNPKNRRAGLEAIHKNTTLAIHAVAWAATTGDPFALNIMSDCGVNAQTMADSASDSDAVIDYLETKLAEDPQFKDVDKIESNWMPTSPPLSYVGWFSVKNRAQTKATPKLSTDSTDAIDKSFKAFDQAAGDDARQLECAKALVKGLKSYQAFAVDRTKHDEMLTATRNFVEAAEARFGDLDPVAETDEDADED